MKITQKKIFFSIIILLVFGMILTFMIEGNSGPKTPGKYDEFATCIKDKGAVFYGAFWCNHCDDQKKLFGSSAKLIPYVECSTANGRGQMQICKENNIEGYPTWTFTDGSFLSGKLPLATLSEKTSCPLPI
jgi:hypothetical protein